MAAVHNTSATLDSTWKETYGEVVKVVPKTRHFQRTVPFAAGEKVGDKFIEPFLVSQEHGVTYLGVNPGVVTLEDANAAIYTQAQVDGYGMLLRSSISYDTADKMATSKQSFVSWSSMMYENMVDSITKRAELSALYGQVGLAVVSANDYASGTTCNITFTEASWADGIWAGTENAYIDFFNGTTKINTNAAVQITAVDFDNRQLAVSGNATDLAAIASTHAVYFKGANAGSSVFKECPGLVRLATNTGTIYNLNAGTYSLLKGVEHSAGSAAFTLSKILAGVAKSAGRGCEDDLELYVSTRTFSNLSSDQSALRRHGGEKKAVNGFEAIEFYAPNGLLRIVPHMYVKNGDAIGYAPRQMKRIGSTDLTFKLPQAKGGEEIFLHLQDKNAYELRARYSWTPYCRKPVTLVYFDDIVNS